MPEHEIDVFQVPPSLNKWQEMHWAARDREKKFWAEEMFALCRNIPRHNKHINISATLWFTKYRKRDVENYSAVLWKIVLDALVSLEIIDDDTAQYVTTGVVDLRSVRVDEGGYTHTVLYLEVV
jgi:hypothetical protein